METEMFSDGVIPISNWFFGIPSLQGDIKDPQECDERPAITKKWLNQV